MDVTHRSRGRVIALCLMLFTVLTMPVFFCCRTYAGQTGIPADSNIGSGSSYSVSEKDEDTVTNGLAAKKYTVAGLRTRIRKAVSAKAVIKDEVRIRPSGACSVELQYYDKPGRVWKTAKVCKVRRRDRGRLMIEYPSIWKNTRTSRWRLVIPSADPMGTYVSDTVTIISSRPAGPGLSLTSKSAVIMRADDAYVIYGKNKDRRLPNASTTKMLTALLTIEQGDLDSVARMSRKAAGTGYGCLKAKAGTEFLVRDLLNVLLIYSSNDAAVCLAERNAGTIPRFCSRMNRRARQLGCKNTHFVNPYGINQRNHYSSSYDLALIQRECIRHRVYTDILQKRHIAFTSVGRTKTRYRFITTNDILGRVKGLMGGKTGHTSGAGYSFCGIYRYKGVVYIYTVLGSDSSEGRWSDSRKLMRFIRKNYK